MHKILRLKLPSFFFIGMIHKLQGALPLKEAPTAEKIKSQFREVSDMYEKHFLRELTKSMRASVPEGGVVKANGAEKLFREQLDEQYVEKWNEKGGVGLSDMIYKDLVDKYGEHYGLKETQEKPTGPLKLNERDNLNVRRNFNAEQNKFEFHFHSLKKDSTGSVETVNPWSGVVGKKVKLNADEYFLEVNHDNGLTSQMKFRGLLQPINVDDHLSAGQKIGILSPDTNEFFWNLQNKFNK